MSSLNQALIFLITTSINLYFFMVLLRFLFQYLQINRYNPILSFVLKATDPIWIPLQRVIPRSSKIDSTSLVMLMILKCLEFLLVTLISRGFVPSIMSLIIWPIGESLSQIINMLFFAVLIVAFLSWLGPKRTPLTDILIQITEPLMAPARKLISSSSGIDFSPLFVLIVLKLIDILFAHPLMQLGERLSYQ